MLNNDVEAVDAGINTIADENEAGLLLKRRRRSCGHY